MFTLQFRNSPFKIIAALYLSFIALFTTLFLMPFTHQGELSFVDTLFLATSGISITGLSPFEVISTLTYAGKIILLIEIQFGGIGIMVILGSFLMLFSRNLSLSQQTLMSFDTNRGSLKSIKRLTLFIFLYAFIVELIGALFFYSYIRLHADYADPSFFLAVFHSVSSFTNAGFDLFGNGLADFNGQPFFLYMTSFLIILGSLGFPSVMELLFKKGKKLSLYTKVNLIMHSILLTAGCLLVLFLEWNHAYLQLNVTEKISNAFFLSASTRNGGFASFPVEIFSETSLFLLLLLMFIGGSASSCGGGIRVSTFFVILARTYNTILGKEDVVLFKKSLYREDVQKAHVIFFSFLSIFIFSTFVLSFVEKHAFSSIAFEVMSALTTTGLSLGITGDLTDFSKVWLCVLMIIGRIGIISFIYALISPKKTHIRYAKEHIIVG